MDLVSLIIRVKRQIKNLRPSIKIKHFLIGEGEEPQNLKKMTNKFELDEEVKFLGSCSLKK